MFDTPEHPLSQRKADSAREKDCIQCLACKIQCTMVAIKLPPSSKKKIRK
jgi:NAD-dependent dihydropyrimidine dehydrogenase PreA subunit